MLFFATSDGEVITIVALTFAVLTGIFWMVVGWRAMRAHERLADSHEALSRTAHFIAARQVEEIEATVVPVRPSKKPAVPTEPDQY